VARAFQEQAVKASPVRAVKACPEEEAVALEAILVEEANPCHLSSYDPVPLLHLMLGGK